MRGRPPRATPLRCRGFAIASAARLGNWAVVDQRADRSRTARHRGVAGDPCLGKSRPRNPVSRSCRSTSGSACQCCGDRRQFVGDLLRGSPRWPSELISRIVSIRYDWRTARPSARSRPRRSPAPSRRRVQRRGVGRQHRHQPALDILLEHRQFETVRRQYVGHPHRAAARAGNDRDPVAARRLAVGEGGRDIDHVIEILAADDAVVAENRVVGRPACASAPVCEAAARRPASERPTLATIIGLPARAAFSATAGNERVADALEKHNEDVGAAGVEHQST